MSGRGKPLVYGDEPVVDDDDEAPPSVPFELTIEQRRYVQAEFRRLYLAMGDWTLIAYHVGYPERYVVAFVSNEVLGSRFLAAKVAQLVGVDLDDLLEGRLYR